MPGNDIEPWVTAQEAASRIARHEIEYAQGLAEESRRILKEREDAEEA